MRTPREAFSVAQGLAMTHGTILTRDAGFPLGKGYEALRLSWTNTQVAGTGATPNVLGSYAYIKNVNLLTSKNEPVCDCPGLGLYLLHLLLRGCEPPYTVMAVGSAAYQAALDIPFALPPLQKQDDLFLDTAQYNKLTLNVLAGTPTDFLQAPGTATFASAMDITVLQTAAAMLNRKPIVKGTDLSKLSRPVYVPYIRHLPCQNPTLTPNINIEIADDLFLLGIIMFAQINNAALTPYLITGTPSYQLLNVNFGDNFIPNYLSALPPQHFAMETRQRMYLPSGIGGYSGIGVYPHFFVSPIDSQGSIRERYWTGQKSNVTISWTPAGGANPSVDTIIFGYRKMRP